MKQLLLISNSASQGEPYLAYAAEEIAQFLGSRAKEVLFVPYAAITFSYDDYVAKVNQALASVGVEVRGLHTYDKPLAALSAAQAIMVGGGNTFALLHQLQQMGAVELIRERVLQEGVPYIGWSAGSNLACPTIRTTNDMPICAPESLRALRLIDFQINPHYLDAHPEGHGGETREQRIQEFITYNPDIPVVGLREGSMIRVEGGLGHPDRLTLIGQHEARLFRGGTEPVELAPGNLCW